MVSQLLVKAKQFKTLAGQKIYRAIHGKPKSLGDGLKRVVGRNAHLVEERVSAPKKAKGGTEVGQLFALETKGGIVTRRYSNGVVLQRGDIAAGQRCEFGGFALPMTGDDVLAVSKNGEMRAVRSSRSWDGAFGMRHYSRDVVTANNSNYISSDFDSFGRVTNTFERNRASNNLGMYQEAFRQLT